MYSDIILLRIQYVPSSIFQLHYSDDWFSSRGHIIASRLVIEFPTFFVVFFLTFAKQNVESEKDTHALHRLLLAILSENSQHIIPFNLGGLIRLTVPWSATWYISSFFMFIFRSNFFCSLLFPFSLNVCIFILKWMSFIRHENDK